MCQPYIESATALSDIYNKYIFESKFPLANRYIVFINISIILQVYNIISTHCDDTCRSIETFIKKCINLLVESN